MNTKTNFLRNTIAVLLFTALAAGMSACSGSTPSDSAQSQNSPAVPAASSTAAQDSTAPKGDQSKSDQPQTDQAKAAQKAERQQKREAVRKQIEAVLTPDQAKQLATKLQQGEKMRQALSELNLTADQKTKIQAIRKAAYPQQPKPSPEASQ